MSYQSRQAEYTDDRSTQVSRDLHAHPENADKGPRFELRFPQILAGALAAASAAVAASWLGVAGTVLGAVVASVVVSITSAVYSHPIERSSQVIREVLPLRPDGYRPSGATSATQTLVLEPMTDTRQETDPLEPGDASSHLDDVATNGGDGEATPAPRRPVSWAAIVVSAVLTLVVGFGILTAFEAVLGRSAASLTGSNGGGGTTFSHIVGNNGSGNGSHDQQPTTPTQTDSPTDDAPTSSDPTESPTTDDPTTTDPTTPEPTEPTPTSPTETQPPAAGTPGDAVDPGTAEGLVGGEATSSGGSGTL